MEKPMALKYVLLMMVMAVLALPGCEENPARSDNGDHANAVGFSLMLGDRELAHYFAREYSFNTDGGLDHYVQGDSALYFHSDHLDAETMRSETIRVVWLDQNRDPISLPEYADSDGDWELRFQILEPGSRSVRLDEGDWPYEVIYNKEQQTWEFQLEALQNGRGDLRIILWHLDHEDVLPVPLPIVISIE